MGLSLEDHNDYHLMDSRELDNRSSVPKSRNRTGRFSDGTDDLQIRAQRKLILDHCLAILEGTVAFGRVRKMCVITKQRIAVSIVE